LLHSAPKSRSRSGTAALPLTGVRYLCALVLLSCSSSGPPETQTREAEASLVWSATAPLTEARHMHDAVRLLDGRVLVAGGISTETGNLASAELYDPEANSWSAAGTLGVPRYGVGMALVIGGVRGGHVVAAGGLDASPIASADLYDPSTNSWTPIAPMASGRAFFQLLSLPSSASVVAMGGSSIELWDSYANAWQPLPAPTGAPATVNSIVLQDGRVLMVHGIKDYTSNECVGAVEILDPIARTLTPAPSLTPKRCDPLLAVLSDGKVLAAGGRSKDTVFRDVEVFDPGTSSWAPAAPMPADFVGSEPVRLRSGKILFAGGYFSNAASAVATLYDPGTNSWSEAPPLAFARQIHSVTPLLNGAAIVVGGIDATSLSSVEAFEETGNACSKAEDCGSRFCVDGVCCDRACAGTCEACDVSGKVGTCSPVAGAPHGSRPACDAGGGDVCKARVCDGQDPSSCAGFTTAECKPSTCTGETFTPAAICDGTGNCANPPAIGCGSYACDVAGCLTSCTSSDECAKGLVCKGRACVSGCSQDLRSAVGADGVEVSCHAYLCDPANGACRSACTTSLECAPGNACDATGKACVQPSETSDDSSGCSCRLASRAGTSTGVLVLAALLVLRRRRARCLLLIAGTPSGR
jgi:hypothetical protein